MKVKATLLVFIPEVRDVTNVKRFRPIFIVDCFLRSQQRSLLYTAQDSGDGGWLHTICFCRRETHQMQCFVNQMWRRPYFKKYVEKAYNHFIYSFLIFLMHLVGVRYKWIKGCIELVYFVVLINGSPFSFFKQVYNKDIFSPFSVYLNYLGCGNVLTK